MIEWNEINYQDNAKQQALQWIHTFERQQTKKALCICGPSGIGKSTFARALFHTLSYQWIESNANTCRSKNALLDKLNTVIHSKSVMHYLQKQKVGIIIDELDAAIQFEKIIFSVLKKDILPWSRMGLNSVLEPTDL